MGPVPVNRNVQNRRVAASRTSAFLVPMSGDADATGSTAITPAPARATTAVMLGATERNREGHRGGTALVASLAEFAVTSSIVPSRRGCSATPTLR